MSDLRKQGLMDWYWGIRKPAPGCTVRADFAGVRFFLDPILGLLEARGDAGAT